MQMILLRTRGRRPFWLNTRPYQARGVEMVVNLIPGWFGFYLFIGK